MARLRFWSKVNKTDACWLWTAATTRAGYGVFRPPNSKLVYAHRFSYEMAKGPIPEGMALDHLCRVRNCINPTHLEPVTVRENNLRGFGASGTNARKTHCHQGHRLAEENLVLDSRGRRECVTCRRARYQKRNAERRALRTAPA